MGPVAVRHYRDVAASAAIWASGRAIRDLHAMFSGRTDDWRAERVLDDALALIRQPYRDDMAPEDAAALCWFVRNSHLFRLELDQNPRVMLLNYHALVADPLTEIAHVYDSLAREPPSRVALSTVQRPARSRHPPVALATGVEEACRELRDGLQRSQRTQALGELSNFPGSCAGEPRLMPMIRA